jgi:GxxExxY protein
VEHEELTEKIIGCAMTVHRVLGPGFLESVYQKSLAHELMKAGIDVASEKELVVHYDGVVVGTFKADLCVRDDVIVETKAVLNLAPAHEAQLVNYLTATQLDVGLLLNFGASRLEFKRKHRTYRPKNQSQEERQNTETGLQDEQDEKQEDWI